MSKLKFLMGYLTHYNAQKISIQYILTGNQPHDPNGVQPIHRIHQSHATGFFGGVFLFCFFLYAHILGSDNLGKDSSSNVYCF